MPFLFYDPHRSIYCYRLFIVYSLRSISLSSPVVASVKVYSATVALAGANQVILVCVFLFDSDDSLRFYELIFDSIIELLN